MVDHSIKGKTVLVTGGAKNLGGLIARDLAALSERIDAASRLAGAGEAHED